MAQKKKSLKERAMERAKNRKASGHHQAVFTALLPEISDALSAGLAMRVVWEELTESGEIDMSYDNFRKLCNGAGVRASGVRRRSAGGQGADDAATLSATDKKPEA